MSLFKARDFWTVTTDDSEEQFDHNSLKVTRLNSDSDYIIVGSHSGVLRIFKPSTELCEDSTLSNFRATDVLIEKVLDAPIFQIESGKLVSYVSTANFRVCIYLICLLMQWVQSKTNSGIATQKCLCLCTGNQGRGCGTW